MIIQHLFQIIQEFMKEANFQNMVPGSQNWSYGDFNAIANSAPVKIVDLAKENATYICSTTDIQGNSNNT